MAVLDIVIFPDDRLRRPTKEVTVFDDALQELIDDMFETMAAADGIGLAAPQIGVSKKIAVIDICDYDEEGHIIKHNPLVLINPKITSKIGECESKEGCLSVPETYEVVHRAEKVTVEAQDAKGEMQTIEADGLLAICLQHEIDHLDGHVFVDYLSSFKRNKITKNMKNYLKHLEQEKQ